PSAKKCLSPFVRAGNERKTLTGYESEPVADRIKGKSTPTSEPQVCLRSRLQTGHFLLFPQNEKSMYRLVHAPSTSISSQPQQLLKIPVPPHNKGFYFPVRSMQDCNTSLDWVSNSSGWSL
ncbi:unnamed protein product, partial [Ectocarpus sp. 12 AP-2014]